LPIEIISEEKEKNINRNQGKAFLIHYPNGVEIHISDEFNISTICSLVKLY
jgi:hypothetical protein